MPESRHTEQTLDAKVAIGWAPDYEAPARALARKNKLPIINELAGWRGLCFYLDDAGWSLIEFAKGKLDFRGAFRPSLEPKYLAQGKDPLINAMGRASTVLDMTAGWGGDAIHLAASGRSVVAVERHSLVYQLLEQALVQGVNATLKNNLSFLQLDSAAPDFRQTLIQSLGIEREFELVYLDPMFVGKAAKRAMAKKPMRLMQRLVAAPQQSNENALFENAMQIAKKRVVVKRALKAPYIAGNVPQGSVKSKLLRFDLYKP